MVGGGRPLLSEILGQPAPVRAKSPIFTALHGMQTRSYDENSVRPSVRLSVRLSNACIVTKRKKNRSRFLYHTKYHSDFSLVLREEEWLVGATPSI